jgi:archaellum component FlaC
MVPLSLSGRVTMLEKRVDRLELLPGDIASFREEVREQFDSAARRFEAIDRRFAAIDRRFDAIDRHFDRVDERFDLMDGKMTELVNALLERIDEGSRRTTVLYEDLVSRIATLGERSKGTTP